jgi:GntR family transcriptional repressor for pyruvate dehydrogenase complex
MTPTQRPGRLSMFVARRVLEDIKQLGLEAGDKLPAEEAMLADYQVGRGTLREAMRILELHGAVTIRTGRAGGVLVKAPTASDLSEILELTLQVVKAPYSSVVESRTEIEPIVARLAAMRVSDDDLATLRTILDAMAAAFDDKLAFVEANRQFSAQLATNVGNPLLTLIANALSEMIFDRFAGGGNLTWDSRAIYRARQDMYQCIADRDADAAEVSARRYVDEYNKHIARDFYDLLQGTVQWL